MHVLLITPKYEPHICGNTTTVRRIATQLNELGVQTTVLLPQKYTPAINANCVHIFHATKGHVKTALPHVITITGTDLNVDAQHPEKRALLQQHLQNAQHITTFEQKDLSLFEPLPPVTVIPQAVTLGNEPLDVRAHFGIPEDHLLFLLVANIRQVKDPLYAVTELEQLQKELPLTLLILGEVADHALYDNVKRDWVTLGTVPHSQMCAVYKAADMVLNTSDGEGPCNALAEAMTCGARVLAADVPGNTFAPARYKKQPGALAAAIRQQLYMQQTYTTKFPTPQEEAHAYKKIYTTLIS